VASARSAATDPSPTYNTSPGRPGTIMNLTQRILTAKARLKIQFINEEIELLRYELMCTEPGSQAHDAMLNTIDREMTCRSQAAAVCELNGVEATPMQVEEMILWGSLVAVAIAATCTVVPAVARSILQAL